VLSAEEARLRLPSPRINEIPRLPVLARNTDNLTLIFPLITWGKICLDYLFRNTGAVARTLRVNNQDPENIGAGSSTGGSSLIITKFEVDSVATTWELRLGLAEEMPRRAI